MRAPYSVVLPLMLTLAPASPAAAQALAGAPAAAMVLPPEYDQIVYKGLLGNVLDAVPMDASERLSLQRTNAVVSSTFLGRSLAVLAGLSNPALLLGGFAWGVWAASNIKAAGAELRLAADAARTGAGAEARVRLAAPVHLASSAGAAAAPPEPAMATAKSVADSGAADPMRPRVFKVWLPQRSPAAPGYR